MSNVILPVTSGVKTFSSPEPSILLTCGRNREALGATISGMRHRCRLRETGWAEFGYFLCYFKMVAPTGGPSSRYDELYCVCVFFFFLLLCERSAKRDMGHILTLLYYLTIELEYAKRDSRVLAHGGVVLQRLKV